MCISLVFGTRDTDASNTQINRELLKAILMPIVHYSTKLLVVHVRHMSNDEVQ